MKVFKRKAIMLQARKCLDRLKDYVPGKSKGEVAQKWGLPSIIKLASNENPLGVPTQAREAIRQSAEEVHLYPLGHSPELQNALAQRMGLEPEQFIFANGSDEIIWLLATAYLNPEEKVLSSVETFSEYEFCSYLLDGQYEKIPLNNGAFDLQAFAKKISEKNIRMVFLCSPNNPTGVLIPQGDLREFLQNTPKDILVVVDQAYVDFVDPEQNPPLEKWLEEFPNLVLLRTFSKMYGLAGLRLGFAISQKETIANMMKVKQPFNVNIVAQKAGLAALTADDFVAKTLLNNAQGQKRLEKLFEEFGLFYFPTQANFICFKLGLETPEFCLFCEKNGLILRNLASFKLPEYIRITIGLPAELDVFEKLLRDWMNR